MFCNLMTVMFAHIFSKSFSVTINGFFNTDNYSYSTVPSESLLNVQSLLLVG